MIDRVSCSVIDTKPVVVRPIVQPRSAVYQSEDWSVAPVGSQLDRARSAYAPGR